MFYLLVKVSFAYLIPVSYKSLCISVLSTKGLRVFFTCIAVGQGNLTRGPMGEKISFSAIVF